MTLTTGVEHSMPNGTAKPYINAVQRTDTFKLGNFAIDEARPIKVVTIGAGFTGKCYLDLTSRSI